MKKFLTAVVVASLLWALPTYAVDEHHPEQQKGAPAKAAPKDSPAVQKQPAPSKAVPPTTSTPEGAGVSMGMMDNMQKMQEQMQRFMQTQDPREREKLLQEHMQTMQEQMKMMSGMMGHGMMSDGKSGGMPADQRMQQMENRMDMMQKMMEQRLKHQEQKTK